MQENLRVADGETEKDGIETIGIKGNADSLEVVLFLCQKALGDSGGMLTKCD